MTAMPLVLREGDFQKAVIQLGQQYGWKVAHVGDSRRQIRDRRTGSLRLIGDRQAAGLPDLVMARERVLFIELKVRSPLTDQQAEWLQALKQAGAEVYVFKPADWPEIQRALGPVRSMKMARGP